MIDFSEFGQGDPCVLSPSISIPAYEIMSANEVLEIAALKEVTDKEAFENPVSNMEFQIKIVGIVMRSRIGEEWSDREVGRLPVPILRKAFEFCSKQVIQSQQDEPLPGKKKKASKGITELIKSESEIEVA